jgi:hypothetical protein
VKDSSCIGIITRIGVFNYMNTRRRFVRLVDLRVHHYFAGWKASGAFPLGRVNSIESLAHDASDFKAGSVAEKIAQDALL